LRFVVGRPLGERMISAGRLPIYGNVDALFTSDRCWSVSVLGGRQLAAEGWIDPRGRLLFAYRVPSDY
jgi:hypothetical protein